MQVLLLLLLMNHQRSDCPISCSLEIWGDKWSLLIIRDLMFAKQCTYGDFLRSGEKIATNILASRLKMLEQNEVIRKIGHPDSRSKVLYQLTEKGIDLIPILVEINLWANKYSLPTDERGKMVIESVKKDKNKFIRQATERLKEGSV